MVGFLTTVNERCQVLFKKAVVEYKVERRGGSRVDFSSLESQRANLTLISSCENSGDPKRCWAMVEDKGTRIQMCRAIKLVRGQLVKGEEIPLGADSLEPFCPF